MILTRYPGGERKSKKDQAIDNVRAGLTGVWDFLTGKTSDGTVPGSIEIYGYGSHQMASRSLNGHQKAAAVIDLQGDIWGALNAYIGIDQSKAGVGKVGKPKQTPNGESISGDKWGDFFDNMLGFVNSLYGVVVDDKSSSSGNDSQDKNGKEGETDATSKNDTLHLPYGSYIVKDPVKKTDSLYNNEGIGYGREFGSNDSYK